MLTLMHKIPLQSSDLAVGDPLAWPVYASGGRLLLSAGYVLKTDQQKAMLLSQELFRYPTRIELDNEKAALNSDPFGLESPFEHLDTLIQSLRSLIETLFQTGIRDYNQALLQLAASVQKLCRDNKDAVLGAIILNQAASYVDLHPILCALLTEMLTKRRQIPEPDRLPYIAAALTQNLGMWHEQAILSAQTTPLTPQQRKIIHDHADTSCHLLKALGIDNSDWLETIHCHHERIDGKGYPNGLAGEAIPEPARILALADIYSAMVLPRQYRDGIFVKKALRDIFMQRGSTVDENLAQLLIREIGIYPPGSFVLLNNGEIAIVLKHNANKADCPWVLSITSPRGVPYESPRKRNTEQEHIFAIEKVIPRPPNLELSLEQIWGVNHIS
jgi:HD-GYP domain-containing protein (c-di-GMP phosphodiesterase class II)